MGATTSPAPARPRFPSAPRDRAPRLIHAPADAVARELGSHLEHGLTAEDAAARLATHGPNRLPRPERPAYLRLAARQLLDPLSGLLILAAAVSFAIGEHLEAGVIAAIVVLNAVLGFVQELGAERALLALRSAVEPIASVVRGGHELRIPAHGLVPGDLVVLREGDRVPADGRLAQAERLQVDESALTGESAPVGKQVAAVPPPSAAGRALVDGLRGHRDHPRPWTRPRHRHRAGDGDGLDRGPRGGAPSRRRRRCSDGWQDSHGSWSGWASGSRRR